MNARSSKWFSWNPAILAVNTITFVLRSLNKAIRYLAGGAR